MEDAEALDKAVRENRKHLKKLRRAQRRQVSKQVPTKNEDLLAATIYCLVPHDVTISIRWLRDTLASRGVVMTAAELAEHVGQLTASWTPAQRDAFLMDGTPSARWRYRIARNAVREYTGLDFVVNVNVSLGVAPSTNMVYEAMEPTAAAVALGPAVAPAPPIVSPLNPPLTSAQRTRVWRFRKKSSVRLGHIDAEPGEPTATKEAKAIAAFKLFNGLLASIAAEPDAQEPLILNLDETSVAFCALRKKGHVIGKRIQRRRDIQRPTISCDRDDLRTNCTLVATLASDFSLQPVVPQFIIVNEKTVALRDLLGIRASLPANFRLIRQLSAWNNADVQRIIIREIARSIRTVAPRRRIVLLVDTVRCHIQECVLRTARSCRVALCFIPAKLTYILQPLDTHVFGAFKRVLRDLYGQEQVRTTLSVLPVGHWIGVVVATTQRVLEDRDWSHSFGRDGFSENQLMLSTRVKEKLGWVETPVLPASSPTEELLATVLPRRTRIGEHLLRAPTLLALPGPSADIPPAPKAPPLLRPSLWIGRTRRTSRSAAAETGAEEGSLPAAAALALPPPPLPPPALPPPGTWIGRTRSSSQLDGRPSASSTLPSSRTPTTARGCEGWSAAGSGVAAPEERGGATRTDR